MIIKTILRITYTILITALMSGCGGTTSEQTTVEATIQGESILPIQGKTSYDLWKPIISVTEVRQGDALMYPDIDYQLVDGKLTLTPGSHIQFTPADFIKAPDGRVNIRTDYHLWQVRVTYQTAAYQPARTSLGTFRSVTFYGDSITEKYDAYYAPPFAEQVGKYIGTCINKGVAGAVSAEGVAAIGQDTPDLSVIGYGMNDASRQNPRDNYKANIKAMIDLIRSRNSRSKFILIASMTGNPEHAFIPSKFPEYRAALYELSNEYSGVAVADVTAVWDDLLKKKTFYDVTGNGVNHPNDFGHWIYAQTVLSLL